MLTKPGLLVRLWGAANIIALRIRWIAGGEEGAYGRSLGTARTKSHDMSSEEVVGSCFSRCVLGRARALRTRTQELGLATKKRKIGGSHNDLDQADIDALLVGAGDCAYPHKGTALTMPLKLFAQTARVSSLNAGGVPMGFFFLIGGACVLRVTCFF